MPRKRIRRLAFSVGVTCVLFAALEGGLRIGGFSYTPGDDVPTDAKRHELTDSRMYVPDADLLWRLRPGSTIDVGDVAYPLFHTNEHGLRGGPVPRSKAPGELRVLCLGDSVMFGQGLEEGQTLPDQLAVALSTNPPDGHDTVTVLNGGVSGYSSVQGERLHARLSALEPDVVVFWFGINDAKPAHGAPDAELRLPGATARALWNTFGGLRVAQLAASMTRPDSAIGERVPPDTFAGVVERFAALAQDSAGPRVIFVRFPERMGQTLAQLEALLDHARGANADAVAAPHVLLSPYAPDPGQTVPRPRVVERGGRQVAVFGPADRATHTIAVDELATRARRLREWEAALDALSERLPPESLDFAGVFGDATPGEVFEDNCHLTPFGARAAAAHLAEAARRAVAAPPR